MADATYDFPAVAARLARPAVHRQVIAVARVANGLAFGQAQNVLDAYRTAYGDGAGSVHVAFVVYGRGVVLGLRSQLWKTYGLAGLTKQRGDDVRPGDGKPFEEKLATLTARAATMLVCDNALANLAEAIVARSPVEGGATAVHAALRAGLANDALLVPAGVAAIGQAQEAGFTLLVSSV